MDRDKSDLSQFRDWVGGQLAAEAGWDIVVADILQDPDAKAKALKDKTHALIYQNPPRRTHSSGRLLFHTKALTQNFWAEPPSEEY